MILHVCRPGYESFLVKELAGPAERSGPGWVLGPAGAGELCFAHLSFVAPQELSGRSVNALAGEVADFFAASVRRERFEEPWPFCLEASELPGLARRARTVEEETQAAIKSRLARVAKLAVHARPAPGRRRGLFAYMHDFGRIFVAREALAAGQRRMADDPQAPSRSYLKIEEAYVILGREPAPGETVVDLGAAPGGWSYSAARRGARVTAVDNGPLKGGGLHPGITHRTEDAFRFRPKATVDWFFCDMVEDPERVIALTNLWLAQGWCKRLVVNLKFGRHDPLRLLDAIQILKPRCSLFKVLHLFHDRQEMTLAAEER